MTVVEGVMIDEDDSRYAVGGTVGRDLVARQVGTVRERPELVLSEDEIRDRTRTYVPVGGHDAIRKTLELYRFVALAGPAGSGVETTAIAVLGQLVPAGRIRRSSTEPDDAGEPVRPEAGGGHIVRARDSDPSRLRHFLSVVRASRGFAVIIGTPEEYRRFAEFPAPTAVEPPPAVEVYRSHLVHRSADARWLHWPRGTELLKGASPGEASRLAGLVDEISAEGGGEREVEHAYRERAERPAPQPVPPEAPAPGRDTEDTHRAVRRFAALASRCDAHEQITRTAWEWAEGRRADLAYLVLSETCLDPVVGGAVRSGLYDWSRQSRTPQTLKLVIARVCQIIGQSYPQAALTRLMHLATHGDAQVRGEVVEVAVELAEQDASTVFTAALRWVRSTPGLPAPEAESRLDTAMGVLAALLPAFTRTGPRQMLEAVDHVAAKGDPRLRPHLLKHARTLAEEHPRPVLSLALEQSGAPDSPLPRQTFGTELLLSLIASVRLDDLPDLLTVDTDPLDAVTAWAFALESPADFPHFPEALTRWLDLAETRPDLIDPLYAAAWHRPETRRLLTDLVTDWADGRPERRRVKEALLVHILLPEWRRRLLATRIRLRGGG